MIRANLEHEQHGPPAIPSEDLQRAGALYGQVKDLRLRLTNVQENTLERAFDTHIAGVLERLGGRLAGLEDPRLRHIELVMANHGLVDASFQQLVLLAQTISPALGEIVKTIRGYHSAFMTDLQRTAAQFLEDIQERDGLVSHLNNQLANSEGEIAKLMDVADLLDQEAEDNQRTIVSLREQIRKQDIEILHLTSAAGTPLTATQVTALSAAKQTMTTGGGTNMKFGASGGSDGGISSPLPTSGYSGASVGPGLGKSAMRSQQPLGNFPKQHGENWIFLFRADLQRAMDTPNKCRIMTINEAKDLVSQLFDSKVIANNRSTKKGSAASAVAETMEMHVYKTMEKKYGLRSLAAEHTGALLTSVQKYCQQDNGILVFMKIFSNEVEEEFREVQTELSGSIADLLRVQIMSKYPSKDQQGINALLGERMSGILPEEEWTDIVNYLYNSSDSKILNSKLRAICGGSRDGDSCYETASGSSIVESGATARKATWSKSKEQKEAEMKKYGYLRSNTKFKKDSSKKLMIAYEDFVKCILDFQLETHQKFLSRFVAAFRQVDINLDGVINPEEFHDLFLDIRFDGIKASLLSMEQRDEAEDIFRTLLSIVDPQVHNRITFSAAASCLSRLGSIAPKQCDRLKR